MQENKEFEEYSKSYSSKTQSLYDTIGAVSKFLIPDLDRFRQESYEAGQQSERDKHRWIPVTERLPTEKDGQKCSVYVGKKEELHKNCVSVLTSDCIRVSQECFDLDKKEFCINNDAIAKWQPLPEA